MLEELKKAVYEANMDLPRYGLVTFTWGNVSGIDRESGLFVIKPSGVEYDQLTPEDMVVMDLDGNKIEGSYRPSSDTATHLELYRAFPKIGGIVHTHSSYATSWAQAGRGIPCYGTTHAEYMYGEIPCVRCLTPRRNAEACQQNTGRLIVGDCCPDGKGFRWQFPQFCAKTTARFTWGNDAREAVHNAVGAGRGCKNGIPEQNRSDPQVKPAPRSFRISIITENTARTPIGEENARKLWTFSTSGDVFRGLCEDSIQCQRMRRCVEAKE